MRSENIATVQYREAPEAGLLSACAATFRRDLLIAFRNRQDIVNPLVFFVIVVSLFPLGVTPEVDFLREAGAGIIWVAALLAVLLALGTLFRHDYEDGTLEQWTLAPHPLFVLSLVRALTAWLISIIPLVVLAPVLGLMLHLPADLIGVLCLTLLLGSPVLVLIGAIGAALTVSIRSSGVLLSLLILPFYVPVLIFATGAVGAASEGLPFTGHLAILGIFLALALSLAPLAIAAALRMSVASG